MKRNEQTTAGELQPQDRFYYGRSKNVWEVVSQGPTITMVKREGRTKALKHEEPVTFLRSAAQ